MISFDGKIIHSDPVSEHADYSKLPKADLILVPHYHYDHFDLKAIKAIKTGNTALIVTQMIA
jgi:L-ascorbate metabolism protein UlaG (beta-lactamase superfamily)